jgi:outer membrane usher protein
LSLRNKRWIFLIYCGLGQIFTLASADEILYLEIVINGRNTTHIAEVAHKENDWEISTKELTGLGIKLDVNNRERILLSEIHDSQVVYDSELQRLLITVPSNLLPMQYFGANIPGGSSSVPRRDPGLFINYNAVSISGNSEARMSSLWHELHFFNNNFFFVNSGIAQDNSTNLSPSGYTRFDTYFQRDNEADLQSVTIGDVINATPNWGRSVRMGGIRIARDYELNPNVITYPLPEFYGESALPGSVDLIINNQLRWRDQVTSGPFLINMAPYMSGAGVAQVVTTNAQGQQVRQSVNFYVTNELLAPKMIDYDITFGVERKNFGLASNDYDHEPLISTSLRYGANRYLTPQLLVQAGDGLFMGGTGLTFLAGSLGVVDIAAAASNYSVGNEVSEHGTQTSIAYDYSYKKIGINANFLRRYDQYRDLSNIGNQFLAATQLDTQMQVAFSLHDNKLGSFNLGYFRLTNKQEESRSVLNFSWSRYYAGDVTTFLNVSRTLVDRPENAVNFTISIPFGVRGQASDSARRDTQGNWRNQFQAMNNAPYNGGLGWGISVDDSPEKNRYASADWRTKYSELSLSAYHSRDQIQYTGALNGALVFMDKNIYPTRFVTDSFALVETKQSDIPVMIGHQLIGRTDANGKLLVPDLDSYLENRLSIDPMFLPANAIMDSIEQLVIPRRKGGVKVKFPIVFAQSALARVVTPDQQPLPAGAVLADKNSDKNFITGWDGDVYIENLTGPLILFWADGECFVEIKSAEDKSLALPRIGPFICQPVAETNQ